MQALIYPISLVQVLADIVCVFFAGSLAFQHKEHKLFYSISCISFISLTFADIYYNAAFRMFKLNILLSGEFISVAPLMIFLIAQLYNWYKLSQQGQVKIFSWINLPYLLFCSVAMSIIIYFFFTTDRVSLMSTFEDIFSVTLDMLVWFFAIICFGRTKNKAVTIMSLGCMMIVSASLTMTCLFRFDMNNVETTEWPHVIWAAGAVLMALGHIKLKKNNNFNFFSQSSLHANCNWWLLMSSLIVFIIYFGFTFLFNGEKQFNEIHSVLWDVPISLMFTIIITSIISNRFSRVISSPIDSFSQSIESFNIGEKHEIKIKNDINEFKILGKFIEKSFMYITEKIEQEVKISAQVAHDIGSPLAALQVGIHLLPSNFDESIRILLRDAVQNIRDIVNSLDKNSIHQPNDSKHLTQIAVMIDGIVSERRLALSRKDVKFNRNYDFDKYEYFVEVLPSSLKRILTNLINNAYEAMNEAGGEININLAEEYNFCILNIIDNGRGISNKNLKNLFKRGFTTRKEGSGLGLYHAKETLSQWGASIAILSTEGKGTKVSVKIPMALKPLWFVSKLTFLENEIIVSVDDNQSIWQSLQERFKSCGYKNQLIYCSSKDSFIDISEQLRNKSVTYLIDFEFSRKNYNGIDLANLLIKNNNVKNRIFIVTSYSEKKEVQDYCVDNSIRIISKKFAAKVPLELFDINKKLIMLSSSIKDVNNKPEWIFYHNIADFISDLAYFNCDMKIYVQTDMYNQYLQAELLKYGLRIELFEANV
jgi:signal transduction histidine kinase